MQGNIAFTRIVSNGDKYTILTQYISGNTGSLLVQKCTDNGARTNSLACSEIVYTNTTFNSAVSFFSYTLFNN